MRDKDKNFWIYVLKYMRWLLEQQQLWKVVLPLYLFAAGIWFVVYYQELLVYKILVSNKKLEQRVDSLQITLTNQQKSFELILRDVMEIMGILFHLKLFFWVKAYL